MKPFYFKDHTADIAMAVTGTTLADLLTHAAEGLASQLFIEPGKVKTYPTEWKNIRIEAVSPEELLVDWLNELIYLFFTESFLYQQADFSAVEENGLAGTVGGYIVPKKDMVYAKEIKAATFGNLTIERKNNIFYTEIILDL